MLTITVDELRRKGLTALGDEEKVIITVSRKRRYVVLNSETYKGLCEAELKIALIEAQQDYAVGNFVTEKIDNHIARVFRK